MPQPDLKTYYFAADPNVYNSEHQFQAPPLTAAECHALASVADRWDEPDDDGGHWFREDLDLDSGEAVGTCDIPKVLQTQHYEADYSSLTQHDIDVLLECG